MNLKIPAITVLVLALLALLAFFWQRRDTLPPPDPRIGEPVVAPEHLAAARVFEFSRDGASIRLYQDSGDTWRVAEYHDFPIDFPRLGRIATNLREGKILRFVSRNPERIERLGFAGDQIRVLGDDDTVLVAIELGDTAATGSRFLRYSGEPTAYLAELNLWLDTSAQSWTRRELYRIERDQIVAFSLGLPDGGTIAFTRPEPGGTWSSDAAPAGATLKTDRLNRVLNLFTAPRFTHTRGLDHPDVTGAREHARSARLTLADGATYHLTFGRRPAPAAPAPAENADAASSEQPQPGPVFLWIETDPANPLLADMQSRRALEVTSTLVLDTPTDPLEFFNLPSPPAGPADPAEAEDDGDDDSFSLESLGLPSLPPP
ncbi:MAG: DUF4340 domain-containing protein [Puniceicoccaceae bacterium]|nr:MAG: DUF4340 domain-containing protein [Puniceicoccaceae bacterium]